LASIAASLLQRVGNRSLGFSIGVLYGENVDTLPIGDVSRTINSVEV
jgi:hypothetical protein